VSDKVILKAGWGRKELYKYFAELGFKVGCEIGVKAGANAVDMFKFIPGLTLYLVEPFFDYSLTDFEFGKFRHDHHFLHAVARLNSTKNKYNAKWILDLSENGVRKIPDDSLDFVYVDGNHHYDFCMLDIILYSRKVRSGGIISGHDYIFRGVKNAVNDYVRAHSIDELYVLDTISPKGTALDKNVSWFFFKGD